MSLIIFLILWVGASLSLNQSGATPVVNWTDATRDVYIDNEIDRAAQVLTSDSPSSVALISAKLQSAVVLEVSTHTVSTTSKDSFKFAADRASATSQAEMKPAGKFMRIDGPIYFFLIDGKPVLIRAHPGATGDLTLEKLWESVPIWHSLMNNYHPNNQAVAKIKADDKEAVVTIALGTWCPDSKNYVPKLIKALTAANNARIQLKFIGIDNQFREPVSVVQPRRITNVPTVLIERDGREIGRIVETPASGTIEEDLAAILGGKQLAHNGRWERGPLLASGAYSYRDQNGKEVGTETWQLFSTAEGGHLVHSRITSGR